MKMIQICKPMKSKKRNKVNLKEENNVSLCKFRERKTFIFELRKTYKHMIVKYENTGELGWKLTRARPPHGMDVPGRHGMDAQDLPDLVLANFVCCSPCLQLSAFLFLLGFPGLLLVGHLHLKLLPVLLG